MFGKVLMVCAASIGSIFILESIYTGIQTYRSRINTKLTDLVDTKWTEDFVEYILDYLPDWENGIF